MIIRAIIIDGNMRNMRLYAEYLYATKTSKDRRDSGKAKRDYDIRVIIQEIPLRGARNVDQRQTRRSVFILLQAHLADDGSLVQLVLPQ